MLVIEKTFSFNPSIDLAEPNDNINDVLERIEEYIHEKARKTIVQNQPVRVLHISGLADYHHSELAKYLQANSNEESMRNCMVESGEFGEAPVKHCWLKVGDLLIDLTIKQFENCPHCAPEFLRKLFNTHCFVSNNPSSLIYKLYKKADA